MPKGASGASAGAGTGFRSSDPSPKGRITITPRPRSAAAGRIDALDVAIVRIVGNLDGAHARILHRAPQIAERLRTVVREADHADRAFRLQPLELIEPLSPRHQVVHLVDVDGAAEILERARDLPVPPRGRRPSRPSWPRSRGRGGRRACGPARAPPRRTSATNRRRSPRSRTPRRSRGGVDRRAVRGRRTSATCPSRQRARRCPSFRTRAVPFDFRSPVKGALQRRRLHARARLRHSSIGEENDPMPRQRPASS